MTSFIISVLAIVFVVVLVKKLIEFANYDDSYAEELTPNSLRVKN
jgi:hypothetical protein